MSTPAQHRTQSFDILVRAFVNVILANLKEARPTTVPILKWTVTPEGNYSSEVEQALRLSLESARHGNELHSALLDFDPRLAGHVGLPVSGSGLIDADRWIRVAISQLPVSATENRSLVLRSCRSMLTCLRDGYCNVRIYGTLPYLLPEHDCPDVPFGDWRLRSLTSYEMGRINRPQFEHSVPFVRLALVRDRRTPILFGDECFDGTGETWKEIDPIMDCIRLQCQSCVSSGDLLFETSCPLAIGNVFTSRLHDIGTRRVTRVGLDQLRAAKKLYARVSSGRHPAIGLAVDWHNRATACDRDEDAIAYAVIGMEAILLHGGDSGTGEVKHRFSLRIASFGRTYEERLERFKLAGRLYDLRSKHMHGSAIKWPKKGDPSSADYRRDAIRMLSDLVVHFAPNWENPAFTRKDYWIERVLRGLGRS